MPPSKGALEDILAGLNPAQQEAVRATDGPVLILAGAGSGKTKCLTHRMAYIIAEGKASTDEILAITFTNKSAQELAGRITRILQLPQAEFERNPGLAMRRHLPWVGTFHSICVRILRAEHEQLGLPKTFTIFDSDDSLTLIRGIIRSLGHDPKQFVPNAVKGAISGAKNELLSPDEYAKYIQGYFQQVTLEIYRRYQRRLVELGALDFDDLIMATVKMLEQLPAVRQKYQRQFRYIMVDEYQDTNHAQYRLTALLTNPETQNLCVVGDDYQCLLPQTEIQTASGVKKIEEVEKGEEVIGATGFGKYSAFPVAEVAKRLYEGSVVAVTLKSGKMLRLTPEHICFAQIQPKQDLWYVYLMYRADKGYRIGVTRGVRGTNGEIVNGLSVRANQERADKVWIITVAHNISEARYFEEYFSLKYQLPKILFYSYRREGIIMTQEDIDRIYREIDTQANAEKLMEDLLLFPDFPHVRPQAVTADLSDYYPGRCQAYLIQFGESRSTSKLPWHAHRVRLTTSNKAILKKLTDQQWDLRADKKSYRIETSRKHFDDAFRLAESISRSAEVDLCRLARLTKKQTFSFQPASHLRPGMTVPVLEGGEVSIDEVVSVSFEDYEGPVYDVNVTHSHTFVANGVFLHNSIYAWRGANFQNILNFSRDFPQAVICKLEQNYRSTKTIISGAAQVVERIKRRSTKKLWTDNEEGPPISVYEANNAYGEASWIATEIRSLKTFGHVWNDFALLYRTNAQSRVLEEIFLSEGIPYRLVGALRFYERKEVKDLLSYLRYLNNPDDLHSFARAVSTPPRGIGPKTLEKGGEKVEQFKESLAKIRSQLSVLTPVQVLEQVLGLSRYKSFLNDGTPEGEGRIENVEELENLASEFEKLEDFLEHVTLVSDVDNYDRNAEAVTLMSMHASKGLEFTVVFLAGCEEGLFPHMRALDEESEMDEERRLCYVAMTRARKRLYLTLARQRLIHGGLNNTIPSRFIREIDASLLDLI
jgi:DNA helicase II / ATP-dependent DNA helicase PcrA